MNPIRLTTLAALVCVQGAIVCAQPLPPPLQGPLQLGLLQQQALDGRPAAA